MRCLFTCRHLLNSTDLLFKMFFLLPLRISNFSSRQRRHFLDPVARVGICLMMSHAIVYSRLLSFRFQTCLDSSVSFLYFLLLRDLQWFRYLVLKLPPVTPMYVLVCLLSVVVTLASYALQAIAFYWALHGVSAVTWVGAVCVRWVVLAVMSLQYFVVVPFDVGFHIFTAAVADSNSVSVE